MRSIYESEIQELAESPTATDASHERSYLKLVLNVVCILVILWLARDWLLRAGHWLDGYSQKEIARRLGISSGALGFLYFLLHTVWPIFHATTKKKQKRDEEEKKQFHPRYNPIEERDSEIWSNEQRND
jgi:type VI protein secretion system component VasK